jgi:ELWxxDGT repeat protein
MFRKYKIILAILTLPLLFFSVYFFSFILKNTAFGASAAGGINLVSFSPESGGKAVASTTNLALVFDNAPIAGPGYIHIKRSSDHTVFADISATSSEITISSTTVTINPGQNLENNTFYYIEVDSDAFHNSSDEYFAGISSSTFWYFHVEDRAYTYGLIKNINTFGQGSMSSSNYFGMVASTTFFFATNNSGSYLYKTDGTSGGTALAYDSNGDSILAGSGDFYLWNGILYFSANSTTYGAELWRTDGTQGGTYMLKDIDPSGSSGPYSFIEVNGQLLFIANDGTNGSELWKTDGTEVGTVMVKDINSSGGSSVSYLTLMGSYVYFAANDGVNGLELWRSNGSLASTTMIMDIYSGSSGSEPFNLTPMNGFLYFGAYNGTGGSSLWKTDGTLAGTVQISNVDLWDCSNQNECPSMIAWNNYLYFQGSVNGAYTNLELWRSDGTGGGTAIFKDLDFSTGTANSNPRNFTIVYDEFGSSTLYFSASTATTGREVWKTDGTVPGTVLVKDSDGLSTQFLFGSTKSFNHKLYYFVGYGSGNGGLWMTDGTASGTVAVKNSPLSYMSYGYRMFELDDRLYFVLNNGHDGFGAEPWVSDGTIGGTSLIKDIKSGDNSSMAFDWNEFTVVGNELYFLPYGSTSNAEIWKSDGTGAGTTPLLGLSTNKVVNGSNLAVYGNRIYFSSNGLWRVTGGGDNVEQVAPVQSVTSLFEMDGILYFSGATSTGVYLWRSDGTTLGTYIVTSTDAKSPQYLTAMNNVLYFSAKSPSDSQSELFRSDGTEGGTYLVKNINPAGQSSPADFTVLGSSLFFSATTALEGREIWKSDGTSGGTTLLSDIIVGAASSKPVFLRKVGSNICFLAFNASSTVDLWRTDGSSVVKVAGNLGVPTNFRSESALGGEVIDDVYYFITYTSSDDRYHVYSSDSTASGTKKLADLNGDDWYGLSMDREVKFFKYQNSVYVNMGEDLGSNQLWKVGDSATSTYEVFNTNPGRITYQANKQAAVVGSNIVLPYFESFYGGEPYFYYPISLPVTITASSVEVSSTEFSLDGETWSNGRSGSIVRGFVWATTTSPTRENREVSELAFATGTYSMTISSLSCGTDYYYRAFAANKAGVAYGGEEIFRTATCTCPVIDHAASYNSYPTCGPATCVSGYHVSGSSCVADSSSGGGSSGGGGGGLLPIVTIPVVSSSAPMLTVSPVQSGSATKTFSDGSSASITVLRGSVSSISRFRMATVALTNEVIPASDSGARLVGSSAFDITATDQANREVSKFNLPLTITIKIPALFVSSSTAVGVYYFDTVAKKWVLVPGAVFDFRNMTVTFTSDHLTLFVIFSLSNLMPTIGVMDSASAKEDVVLIAPNTSEAANIVNRYYRIIDIKTEQSFYDKTSKLKGFDRLSAGEKDAIAKMVAYGTPSTMFLGAGERLGVVNSYLSAFGHLPKTIDDWSDVIKISNGRWPSASSENAIAAAKKVFKKIYLREPDMKHPNDNAAVTVMAYGLRNAKRNMNSEKAAISIYKRIFRKAPTEAVDWDAVRAIAYSGAKR